MKYGIDVSQFNGEIDWKRVKESGKVDFAVLRSSLGWTDGDAGLRRDKRFLENVAGCEENGLPYGVYHYSYCLRPENAAREAEYLLRCIAGTRPALGVWLDLEAGAQIPLGREAITRIAADELAAISAAGFRAGVYSYLYWLENYMDMEKLKGYPVWLAQVEVPAPTYGGETAMWQYSWKGRVDGITGDVDLDRLDEALFPLPGSAPAEALTLLDALVTSVAEQARRIRDALSR